MVKRISVREARANFADLIGSVQHTGEPVVIERRGKPIVAVVSAGDVIDQPVLPVVSAGLDPALEELVADAPTSRSILELTAGFPRPKHTAAVDHHAIELDKIVADSPLLRAAIEAGRGARLLRPMSWQEVREIGREDYVREKARKKGLGPRRQRD